MTKIWVGKKNTPTFAARAAGQPAALSGPVPAQIEGKPSFHKHFLHSGAKMAAAG